MKAVSATENTPLDLFRASLEVVRLGQKLPPALDTYLRDVITEASKLHAGSLSLRDASSTAIYLCSSLSDAAILVGFAGRMKAGKLSPKLAQEIQRTLADTL